MKRITFLLVVLLAAACSSRPGATRVPQMLAPLPAGYSLQNLSDVAFPAAFTADSICWDDRTMKVSVYAMDLYDAVEVTRLVPGDSLRYQGTPMAVDSMEWRGDQLIVNGGIEYGGACLRAYEGGTWRGLLMDDHASYTLLGEVTLPLADSLAFTDCTEFPEDAPVAVAADTLARYLQRMPDWRRAYFIPINATVRTENGRVTEIVRRWIP